MTTIGLILLSAAFVFGTCIALAIMVKLGLSVMKRAKASGVKLSDGVDLNEAAIIARLIKEEAQASAELAAIETMQRVIAKAIQDRQVK